MQDVLVSFGGGAIYGVASVVTAQPLDTIKTLLQAKTGSKISLKELGLRGLYRGSLPILIGGSTFRSAQFGVYEAALNFLPPRKDKRPFSYQVILAGLAGGIGRGLVESPFEFYKVRLQLRQENFRLSEVYQGASVTIFRNAFLFASFAIYLDCANVFLPVLSQYAFVKGAMCANLAWLSVWPVDVIKSRRQSGLYVGQSSWYMLKDLIKTRALFAGLLPGLARSTIANGSGMYFMTKFVEYMKATRVQ